MKQRPHTFLILIEEDPEVRDQMMIVLAAEGCLVNGFDNLREALRFLKKSPVKVDIILINERASFHEWIFFKSEFDELDSGTAIHIFRKPVDLKNLLQKIEELTVSVR